MLYEHTAICPRCRRPYCVPTVSMCMFCGYTEWRQVFLSRVAPLAAGGGACFLAALYLSPPYEGAATSLAVGLALLTLVTPAYYLVRRVMFAGRSDTAPGGVHDPATSGRGTSAIGRLALFVFAPRGYPQPTHLRCNFCSKPVPIENFLTHRETCLRGDLERREADRRAHEEYEVRRRREQELQEQIAFENRCAEEILRAFANGDGWMRIPSHLVKPGMRLLNEKPQQRASDIGRRPRDARPGMIKEEPPPGERCAVCLPLFVRPERVLKNNLATLSIETLQALCQKRDEELISKEWVYNGDQGYKEAGSMGVKRHSAIRSQAREELRRRGQLTAPYEEDPKEVTVAQGRATRLREEL